MKGSSILGCALRLRWLLVGTLCLFTFLYFFSLSNMFNEPPYPFLHEHNVTKHSINHWCFYPLTPRTHTVGERKEWKECRGEKNHVRKWDGLVFFVLQHGLIWAVSQAVLADCFQPRGTALRLSHTHSVALLLYEVVFIQHTHTHTHAGAHTHIWPGIWKSLCK